LEQLFLALMFNFDKWQSFHVSPEPRPFFAIVAKCEVGEWRLQGAFHHDWWESNLEVALSHYSDYSLKMLESS